MVKISDWSILTISTIVLSFGVSNSIADLPKGPVGAYPVKPKTPQCYGFFPGTPAWNECFQKFMQDMAIYQTQMHDFVKNKAQVEEGSVANEQGYYTESVQHNSNSMSTSNSFVGGYAIRAVNMPISSSIINNRLKVTLFAGPIDPGFDSKVNKNEILLTLTSKGQQKWAKIVVPNGVDILNDVKVDRTTDTIFITGPVNNGGGSFQYTQSSQNSGGSVSSSTNMNQAGQIPSVPMPDFQNMFQSMFQNMFQGIFGGARSMGMPPSGRQDYMRSADPNQYPYYTPQVWFF